MGMTYHVTDLTMDEDRLARFCQRYLAGGFIVDEHFIKAVLRIVGTYDPIYRTGLLYQVEKTIMQHLCKFWVFCDEGCRYKNRREWFEDIRDWVLLETINNPLYKKTIGKRGEISVGMRFDIMKRDGFSCQICGSTQSDGVKLEIDHIMSVAEGGETHPSNLWTLCFACNRGKGKKSI
jgi:hypothetical protein